MEFPLHPVLSGQATSPVTWSGSLDLKLVLAGLIQSRSGESRVVTNKFNSRRHEIHYSTAKHCLIFLLFPTKIVFSRRPVSGGNWVEEWFCGKNALGSELLLLVAGNAL